MHLHEIYQILPVVNNTTQYMTKVNKNTMQTYTQKHIKPLTIRK
jgi:hypothetical protein